MKKNVNDNQSIAKRKGPVWKVKVEVHYPVNEGTPNHRIETKLWKFREILN